MCDSCSHLLLYGLLDGLRDLLFVPASRCGVTNPKGTSKPDVCHCDVPVAEQLWTKIDVPFIPRWGWSGIDWMCSLCDKLRSDSWSVVMWSNVVWELDTGSVVNVVVAEEVVVLRARVEALQEEKEFERRIGSISSDTLDEIGELLGVPKFHWEPCADLSEEEIKRVNGGVIKLVRDMQAERDGFQKTFRSEHALNARLYAYAHEVEAERNALRDAGKGVVDSFNDLLIAQSGGKKSAQKAWDWVKESVRKLRSVLQSAPRPSETKPKGDDDLSPEVDRMLDALAVKHGLSREKVMRRALFLAERVKSLDLDDIVCDHGLVEKYAGVRECLICGKDLDE